MKLIITTLLSLFILSCTPDPHTAISAAEDMGFTNVNLGEHDYIGWGCPEDMSQNISFTAIQPTNQRRVRGVICCDWWGACVVRTR